VRLRERLRGRGVELVGPELDRDEDRAGGGHEVVDAVQLDDEETQLRRAHGGREAGGHRAVGVGVVLLRPPLRGHLLLEVVNLELVTRPDSGNGELEEPLWRVRVLVSGEGSIPKTVHAWTKVM